MEDEIVSPKLRGVRCCVLTTRARPEGRSGEWSSAGGVAGQSSPPAALAGTPAAGAWQGACSESFSLERAPLALGGHRIPQWDHGRGPKVKVFECKPSSVCRQQLPLASVRVVQAPSKLRLGPALQPGRGAAVAARQTPHILLSPLSSQGHGDFAPVGRSANTLETDVDPRASDLPPGFSSSV